MTRERRVDADIDWDDEYANAPYIPGGGDYPDRWVAEADEFRRSVGARAEIGIAYGDHPRQRLDLFRPEQEPLGLVVFVHGGYWMAFDQSSWSHLAAGPVDRGWAVAVVGYVLAPEVSLRSIARHVAGAVEEAARRVPGPLALTGHSAGGHIVTRLVSGGGLLTHQAFKRVRTVASISGVHDLRPLLATSMNRTLGLTPEEATDESPVLLEPLAGPAVSCWVGGRERPEFVRQSKALSQAWSAAGRTPVPVRIEPERHHFDIVELLTDSESDLVIALTAV